MKKVIGFVLALSLLTNSAIQVFSKERDLPEELFSELRTEETEQIIDEQTDLSIYDKSHFDSDEEKENRFIITYDQPVIPHTDERLEQSTDLISNEKIYKLTQIRTSGRRALQRIDKSERSRKEKIGENFLPRNANEFDFKTSAANNGPEVSAREWIYGKVILELNESVPADEFMANMLEEDVGIVSIQPDYVLRFASKDIDLESDNMLTDVKVLPEEHEEEKSVENAEEEDKIENEIDEDNEDETEGKTEGQKDEEADKEADEELENEVQKVISAKKIALIDGGVDITHVDLASRLTDGWDFVSDGELYFDSKRADQYYHGTHVAGIIANTASDALIMPLKVFENGSAYTSDIIDAIYYAQENGATVVNCSWGSSDNNPMLRQVMEESGMLFVCATGNNRLNLNETPIYPASFDLTNVISVTSVNADSGLSYFSNYGDVDIAALGRAVTSTWPNNTYGEMSGTSMAAGLVSGAAMLIDSENIYEIKQSLLDAADKMRHLQDYVKKGRVLNIENVRNSVVTSGYMNAEYAEDFDITGYERTPAENWELFSSLKNVQVSGGYYHSLALKENGTVWAWGENYRGELGTGDRLSSGVPVQIRGLTNIKMVAAGCSSSMAVSNDGKLYVWGSNAGGKLGDGTSTDSYLPVLVSTISDVDQIIQGGYHTFAIKYDGSVYAWGSNTYGQLGDGTKTSKMIPVLIEDFNDVKEIDTADEHSVAVKNDGSVYIWGNYDYTLIGESSELLRPTQIPNLTNIKDVKSGGENSLALSNDGEIYEWRRHELPQLIAGVSGVEAISVGYWHKLILKRDGTVYGWGANYEGPVGDGNMQYKASPVLISGLNNIRRISTGRNHSMALTEAGDLYVWGTNAQGQLGTGLYRERATPEKVANMGDIKQSSMGYGRMSALKKNGTAYTWGYKIVDGYPFPDVTPIAVSGLSGADMVVLGNEHTVALKDGRVYTWGYNIFGQLGDGTNVKRDTPVQVPGLTNIISVAAGENHTAALTEDGKLYMWGANYHGQLGDGGGNNSCSPILVSIDGVEKVFAQGNRTFATTTEGEVYGWGDNSYGLLGNGDAINKNSPTLIPGLTNIEMISPGYNHILALKTDGQVYGWGDNTYGQAGNDFVNRITPELIEDLEGIKSIAAGRSFSLVCDAQGKVFSWGHNIYGQAGVGTIQTRSDLQEIKTLKNIKSVTASQFTSAALDDDGNLYAWGSNNMGILGDGIPVRYLTPHSMTDKITNYEAASHESTMFTPYTCYPQLDFESESFLSKWAGNGAAVQIEINNPERSAHSGNGAVYIDSISGPTSIWGGTNGLYRPQIGDTISGYFYYKKLSQPDSNWKLPEVRLYSVREGNIESSYFCVTKSLNTQSVLDAPLNEWIRVELESTGKVVTAENIDSIEFNITTAAGGNEFMIDDVVFGKYTSLSPYDQYRYLSFEGNKPSVWAGDGATVEFVKNDPQKAAHKGNTALYVHSLDGYYSVWGGPNGFGPVNPTQGDFIGGYFYIKKLREPGPGSDNAMPNIRLYKDDNIPENYYCQTSTEYTMGDLPLNEWVRIDLVSTGKRFEGGVPGFNITFDGIDHEYLIDDLTFARIDASYHVTDDWGVYPGQERVQNSTTTVYHEKAYVIGGMSADPTSDVRIFDLETNTWSSGTPMPKAVSKHSSVLCGNKIYVIGGIDGNNTICDDVQIYNIETDTWSGGADMMDGVVDSTVTLFHGKIYVIGGENKTGISDYTQIYEIAANTWSAGAAMPTGVKNHSAVVYNASIYITGGRDYYAEKNNMQIYAINNDSWTDSAEMPQAVEGHSAVLNGGKIYILGGNTDHKATTKTQIYDISTATYFSGEDMPEARTNGTAAYFNGKIYSFDLHGWDPVTPSIYDISKDMWVTGKTTMEDISAPAILYNDQFYFIGAHGVAVYGKKYGSITMKFVDEEGSTIKGVSVAGAENGISNENGIVQLSELDFKTYKLTISKIGLKTQTKEFVLKDRDPDVTVYIVMGNMLDISKISAGGTHSLLIDQDGELYAWGNNEYGQVGDGTKVKRIIPTHIQGVSKLKAVSGGADFTMVLNEEGEVYTWGKNDKYQLGNETKNTVLKPGKITIRNQQDEELKIKSIAAGNNNAYAVTTEGDLYGWGYNAYSRLGIGNVNPQQTAILVGVSKVKELSVGVDHGVAVTDEGFVYTWGYNTNGQVGHPTINKQVRPPEKLNSLSNIKSVSAGYRHTVALTRDGEVYTWGNNERTENSVVIYTGQLGYDTIPGAKITSPGLVGDIPKMKEIYAGYYHTVALSDDGEVYTWGSNSSGQLGDETTINRTMPQKVEGISNIIAISAGAAHTMAISADGKVYTWGDNSYSQLGDANTDNVSAPILIMDLNDALEADEEYELKIATGKRHSMAINRDGDLFAWGNNRYSQLGNGMKESIMMPTQIMGISNLKEVSGGDDFTISVTKDGEVYSWGNNVYGQLGNGTTNSKSTPNKIAILDEEAQELEIESVAAGAAYSYAVTTGGSVYTWGYNGYYCTGYDVSGVSQLKNPVRLKLENVRKISAGSQHGLAITKDGLLYAWGYNVYGQVGNDTINRQVRPPKQVIEITDAKAVAAGHGHTAAVTKYGWVYTWGSNSSDSGTFGQLGYETEPGEKVSSPRLVKNIPKMKEICTGTYHTVALTYDGEVYAWGRNDDGQLGDGTTTNSPTPKKVEGISNIVAISAGIAHTVALSADGQVYVWGDNRNGKIGAGNMYQIQYTRPYLIQDVFAKDIKSNGQFTGKIHNPDDRDIYRLIPMADGIHVIETESDIGTTCELYTDASLNTMIESDSSLLEREDLDNVYQLEVGKTYYLVVKAERQGQYELKSKFEIRDRSHNYNDYTTTRYAPWILNYHGTTVEQIQLGITGGDGSQAGRSFAISSLDPSDPTASPIMLFGIDTAGVWRSTDEGKTWRAANTGWTAQGADDLCFSPDDPNLVIGIGASYGSEDRAILTQTNGIYRSVDGGKSWNNRMIVPAMQTMAGNYIHFGEKDEIGKRKIYVGMNVLGEYTENNQRKYKSVGELYQSEDDGESWEPMDLSNKLMESVREDGTVDVNISIKINDMLMRDGMIYVCTTEGLFMRAENGGEWTRIDKDKNINLKDSYTDFSTYKGILSFDIDPNDSNHRFLVTASYLYETTNGGEDWNIINDKGNITGSYGGLRLIKVIRNPKDESKSVIYMGVRSDINMRFSYDNGRTFDTPIVDRDINSNRSVRTDMLGYAYEASIEFCPEKPELFFMFLGGQMYKSTDYGQTLYYSSSGWSGLRAQKFIFDSTTSYMGFAHTDFGFMQTTSIDGFSGDYPPIDYRIAIAAGSHEGYKTTYNAVIDPEDSNHIIIVIGKDSNVILKETRNAKSDNPVWQEIAMMNEETDVIKNPATGEKKKYREFLSRFIEYDAQDPNIIYAGRLKSEDGGATWAILDYYVIATSSKPNADGDTVIYGKRPYTTSNDNVYVLKSTDGGETWEQISNTVIWGIQRALVDLYDVNKVYVGSFSNGIFIMDGQGTKQVKNGLGSFGVASVHDIAQNPNNKDHLLCGSVNTTAKSGGLFESFDGGDTWKQVKGFPSSRDAWVVEFHPTQPRAYVATSAGTFVYDYVMYNEYSDIEVSDIVNGTSSKTQMGDSFKSEQEIWNVGEEVKKAFVYTVIYDEVNETKKVEKKELIVYPLEPYIISYVISGNVEDYEITTYVGENQRDDLEELLLE